MNIPKNRYYINLERSKGKASNEQNNQGATMNTELITGKMEDKLKDLPDNSVDSIVTDPPYGISFMGKKWDYQVPTVDQWKEAYRVLKPGGYLLSFAGTRTQHRMAVNIEDAGFEIREIIAWVYASGFPKSLNISKAIDKESGAKPIDLGVSPNWRESKRDREKNNQMEVRGENAGRLTAPNTDDAKQWEGWGTALKPALEPITVARKPLSEKTIAANVLKWGTGGINIDGCRIETEDVLSIGSNNRENANVSFGMADNKEAQEQHQQGRFPANLIHDGSEEVARLFPHTKSGKMKPTVPKGSRAIYSGDSKDGYVTQETIGDSGSASRFFYCAKASKADREEGNTHPTVKPTDLMRYLVRLVTPPKGTVLDPFMGSGSTGKACAKEGFGFIGIEKDPEMVKVAYARINSSKDLFS